MGSSTSKNEVDKYIESVSEIVSSGVIQCQSTSNDSIKILNSQFGCRGDAMIDQTFVTSNSVTLNTDCAQSIQMSADIQKDIDTQTEMTSKSITQAFSLNPGSSSSENILNAVTKLKSSISSSLETIVGSAIDRETILINSQGDSNNCTIKQVVKIDTITKSVLGAMNDNKTVMVEIQHLKDRIKTVSSAEQKGLFDFGGMVLILVILVMGGLYMTKQTSGTIMQPKVLLLGGGIVTAVVVSSLVLDSSESASE